MSRTQIFVTLSICATAITCASLISRAGDLNPPAGPVAPTPGPEPRIAINATNTPGDADSLFRISAPGSYYLTGEITGAAGMHGIEIGASSVAIDLMGYTLRGVPGSLDGIRTDATHQNITIRNGTVTSWGGDGVDLSDTGFLGNGSLFEQVHASSNGGIGLRSTVNGVIRACTAYLNGNTGIFGAENATIEGCASRFNSGNGIHVGVGGVIRGCTARDNAAVGMSAAGVGTITECSSFQNGDDGFTVTLGSTISNCTAGFNFGNGIRASGDCVVLSNTCDSNGVGANDGAGIIVTSGDNRIEGNNCTDNDRGIDVDGSGNLIIRNTCAGNTTNYEFIMTNRYGPIIDITAAGAAPVSGNAAADTTGTTHPWANFAY